MTRRRQLLELLTYAALGFLLAATKPPRRRPAAEPLDNSEPSAALSAP